MITELGGVTPQFRTTISPVIEGADPSKESKWKPPGRAINPRAELIERIHLYEGPVRTVKLGDMAVQVQGFMDISQTFFADGESTNQPFIGWGLRDASTQIGKYGGIRILVYLVIQYTLIDLQEFWKNFLS